MASSTVWTVWKTDARTVRIAEASRAFGVVGTTALMDELLTFWENNSECANRVETSCSSSDSFRCVMCDELIIGFAFLCNDGCYACSSKCRKEYDKSYLSSPHPEPTAHTDKNSVSSRTHTGHTRLSVALETDGDGWAATVAELPGCISQGDTADEALEMIADAMRGWFAVAQDGE